MESTLYTTSLMCNLISVSCLRRADFRTSFDPDNDRKRVGIVTKSNIQGTVLKGCECEDGLHMKELNISKNGSGSGIQCSTVINVEKTQNLWPGRLRSVGKNSKEDFSFWWDRSYRLHAIRALHFLIQI